MDFFNFISNFNYNLSLYFLFSEEIIIVFLFYNFIKLLIFSSIFELIWPTQFFNRRNNFNSQLKFRTITEVFLKLNYKYFNNLFFKKLFLNNFLKNK